MAQPSTLKKLQKSSEKFRKLQQSFQESLKYVQKTIKSSQDYISCQDASKNFKETFRNLKRLQETL
jgi:hypothetical protein